jgi:hypothetical protein
MPLTIHIDVLCIKRRSSDPRSIFSIDPTSPTGKIHDFKKDHSERDFAAELAKGIATGHW